MNEVNSLISLLNSKTKLVAMLAPSFPIVYQYPNIVGKLRRAGFGAVVEVSAGASETNRELRSAIASNPKGRFITSPCPTFVRFIRSKYPQLVKYLAFSADSPMVATAKIVLQKWPGYKPVFIGPCNVKKLEASEDHPDLKILVLTFKEMNEVFNKLNIQDSLDDGRFNFDIKGEETRLYPISGGLAESSHARDTMAEDQIRVVSGWQNCIKAVEEFETNPTIKLLDILFCDGGCINGPGIMSSLNMQSRRQKIIDHWSGQK